MVLHHWKGFFFLYIFVYLYICMLQSAFPVLIVEQRRVGNSFKGPIL